MKDNIVELGFIYALVNPKTNEIFYIGATESAPKDRLAGHYAHFKEYLQGVRTVNDRFEYMESIWPDVATVKLIEIVQNDDLYAIEIKHIAEYRKTHKLTNLTAGGLGGDTFSMQRPEYKTAISQLISSKAVGIKKPDGFGENLSKQRMGANNPAAKKRAAEGQSPIGIYERGKDVLLKTCVAPYEITEFFDEVFGSADHKLHAGRTGNVMKGFRNKDYSFSSGYEFRKI